jgi:pimeloyl-ACP methyl ester carboxylesterase
MTKVFVHGNPETDAVWGPLFSALRARGVDDLVALSPPGFGAPAPDGWTATQDEYREWLVAELEPYGGDVDLVGHDWGAAHVFGALAARPELVRTWAGDCLGLLQPDYVWHDMAQIWQTPDAGEEMVDAMVAMTVADRAAGYEAAGMTAEAAAVLAEGLDETMGRSLLALYRSAVQPAMAEVGQRMLLTSPERGLVLVPTEDPYAGAVDPVVALAADLGASVLTLEGRGHWWMLEDPDPAAEALVAHWSDAGE